MTSDIKELQCRLTKLVGIQFRNPQLFDVTAEKAAELTYTTGFELMRTHITQSSEIANIWAMIESIFKKPDSPPQFEIFSSSSSPSSLSDFSEKAPDLESKVIAETPRIYNSVVKPYVLKHKCSLQWVHSILDHKKESERIAFEDSCPDNGFILLPDFKWDGKTSETIFLRALIHKRDIKSLRDLTADHLPLLRNIRDKSCDVIQQKYGVKRSELRIYLHYQPSFYHLHVHFVSLKHKDSGMHCHRLDTVIDNIEMMPNYYQRATLSFEVSKTDFLYAKLTESASEKKLKTDEQCTSSQGTTM